MIIYIYGSNNFKKEIHSVLNHSNIKFRLDEHGEIRDLKTLGELKNAIEDNPNNIYLIDDEKIIKKNSLNQKIKFLKPKDGIEQEYLLDNGIGDISVDSIEELSKHIIKRLEAVIHEKESGEIQDSIVEIVENAYEKDEEDKENYVQLDDELSELLSHEDTKNNKIDEISSLVTQIDDTEIKEEELSKLEDLSFDEDLDNILNITDELNSETVEDSIENISNDETIQGEGMAGEFSEFDSLNENDILAALNGMDETSVSSEVEQPKVSVSSEVTNSNETIDLNGSNVNDIAELISKLLNNKTLEITVKVKD